MWQDALPVSFERFEAAVGNETSSGKEKEPKRQKTKKDPDDPDWIYMPAQHPSFNVNKKGEQRKGGDRVFSSSSEESSESEADLGKTKVCMLDEHEIEDALTRLRIVRCALREAYGIGNKHFILDELGGRWTRQHLGMDTDAAIGKVYSKEANAFCRDTGMSYASSFKLSRGREQAAQMALPWRDGMLYFLHVHNGWPLDGPHVEDDGSHKVPESLLDAIRTAAGGARFDNTIRRLRIVTDG